MRSLLLTLVSLLVACGDNSGCRIGDGYLEARTDTTYVPFVYPSGDTVQAMVVVSWTAGCASAGVFQP